MSKFKIKAKKDKIIHFIGIGGIGVSALARYYLEKGYQVYGSDLVDSEIIKSLKKSGAEIFIGEHKPENLPENLEKVIYSLAVQPDNPELKKAKKLQTTCPPKPAASGAGRRANYKLQTLSYPQALGELTKKHFTIAVSGTHGKSTTSAMIGLILIKAGLDPTVIIGTKLREFYPAQQSRAVAGSNFRMGQSKYLVIEADEWQASFLNYWPKIIVLTNIEKEHLDYYKDLEHILKTYKEYVGHLPKDGVLVINGEDRNIQKLLNSKSQAPNSKQIQKSKFQIQNFSLRQSEAKKIKEILKIPGEHNVANALAALTVARVLGIDDKISFELLAEYKGSWRRFDISEKKLDNKPFIIINDYAHHPTEIETTLKSIREKYKNKEIWCIFQPHQYQRTFYLFDDFVKVFQKATRPPLSIERGGRVKPVDKLIITDIYDVAGRENKEIKEKVSSQKLAEKSNCFYVSKDKVISYLKENLKGEEVVILMGAGDIYDLNLEFKS